jgi:hypothetical protein
MPPMAISELGDAIARIPVPRTHLMHPAASTSEDDMLASILISMWALASGRFLRRGVRPDELTEQELIDFWADDLTTTTGPPRRTAWPPACASHAGSRITRPVRRSDRAVPLRMLRHTRVALLETAEAGTR